MTQLIDYATAQDEIFGAVTTSWKAATAAIVGSEQKLFYQGVVKEARLEQGAADEYWARVSMQTFNEGSIGPGAKRHTAYGIVIVQMFFPLTKRDAWRNGVKIATLIKNALSGRSSAGTVLFRNPRHNELTAEGDHHRLNVVAEFEYDELVS